MNEIISDNKLPGGKIHTKPIENDGQFYDPLNPPKIFNNPRGGTELKGGRLLTEDEAYAMMFWAKGQPRGLKEAMTQNIKSAVEAERFSMFTGASINEGKLILEPDGKEKFAVYKEIAKELGYKIGEAKYFPTAGTIIAPISKAA